MASVAACDLVLDLPARPGDARVTIRRFVSERGTDSDRRVQAFAGDELVLEGDGFDPDPLRNEVAFPLARAQAFAVEGGTLKVRVPADAGSGPITVSTLSQRGLASEQPLHYLGLGHPRRGVETARRSLRFAPDWTGVVGDHLYSWSPSLHLVVDITAGRPLAIPPLCSACGIEQAVEQPAVLPDGTGLMLSTKVDGKIVSAVWRPGPPEEVTYGPEATGDNPRLELHPFFEPQADLAWLVRTQGSSTLLGRVRARNPGAWLSTTIPIDGRAVVAALDATHAVVANADVDHPGTWMLESSGGAPLWHPLPLPLACFSLTGGFPGRVLCVRSPDGGSTTEIWSLGLDSVGAPALPIFVTSTTGPAPTLLAAPFGAGVQVVVAFEDRGLVIAYDEATQGVRWSFHAARKPAGLSYAPATRTLTFADKDSRDVWRLDAETGAAIDHRWSKPELGVPAGMDPLRPSRADALLHSHEARAFSAEDFEGRPRLRVAAPTITSQAMVLDLFGLVFDNGNNAHPLDAIFHTASGAPWAFRIADGRLFTLDDEGDAARQHVAGRAPASLDVADDGTLGVAFPDALELWSDATKLGEWAPSEADYGADFKLLSVRAAPDGRWIAAVRNGERAGMTSGITLVGFTQEALLGGQPPEESITLDGCSDLFWIGGRLDVVCGLSRKSFGLDLELQAEAPTDGVGGARYMVSPDGRYVAFERTYDDGSPVVTLASASPGEPLRILAELALPYRLTGLAFTPDGEKLIALASDTVIRIE